ncbi:hypothetical protein [Salinispira pacifica]
MSDETRRQSNSSSADSLDPDVAELLSDVSPGAGGGSEDIPDFSDLFEEGDVSEVEDLDEVSYTADAATFRRPEKLEEPPKPYFNDKDYYKKVLGGEGDISKRVHSILGSFLNAKDPQDRSLYRGRLIPAYWDLATHIAGRLNSSLSIPKIFALRYGIILPTLLSAEQRDIFSRIIMQNNSGEPLYYVDEWLKEVGYGRVSMSAQDETKKAGKNAPQQVNAMMEKTRGRFDAQLTLVRNLVNDLDLQEAALQEHVNRLSVHEMRNDIAPGLKEPYTDLQKSSFSEISSILRKLSNVSRELSRNYRELETVRDQLDELKDRDADNQSATTVVDNKVLAEEMNTVRQMAKLCVGRQGNHFPVLMKQYLRNNLLDIGTRENVINILAEVEYLDPGVFLRTFKQQTNRIVPNIVLIPCYGDQGICWEPFERFNRATSRGRLAIPMYPKDLKTAIIAALADLRWQVAKERAQHYWMEEGLTGWYYQWFTEKKMKGDVRESFIQDYILWITKESDGTQKLDRDARDVFWRYLPFPQEVKDKLKNRGFVYAELYKKDQNRAMSDGY